MLFYLTLIFLLLLILGDFSFPQKLTNKTRYILACILVISISIFRFDVGFDYASYYNIIISNGGEDYAKEPISKILMDIGHSFGYPPITFALYSVLTYSVIAYILFKTTKQFKIALFIYVCFFFLESLGTIRQGLSEAVSMLSYPFLLKRKFIKFSLICVLCSLIHVSGIITIVIYPLYHFFNIKKTVILIAILSIGVQGLMELFTSLQYFGSAANHIATGDEFLGGGVLMYFMPFFFVMLFLICKIKKLKIDYRIFSILILGASIPFMIGPHYGMRISKYFNIYICFLLPQILDYLNKKIRSLFLSMCALYFILFIHVGWNKKRPTIAPYQTIFQIENIKHPYFRH